MKKNHAIDIMAIVTIADTFGSKLAIIDDIYGGGALVFSSISFQI